MRIRLGEIISLTLLTVLLLAGQTVLLLPKQRLSDRIYLSTVPSGAEINVPSADSVHGFHVKSLGVRSPGPLPTSLEERSRFTFLLRLPGYQDKEVTYSTEQLRAEQEVILEPKLPFLVPLLYQLKRIPLLVLWLTLAIAYYLKRLKPLQHRQQEQIRLRALGRLESGLELAGYRLGEEVGEGGMSRVFSASRVADQGGEVVAFKALHPRLTEDPDSLRRFRKEVQLWKQLSHPNIVHLLDWGEVEGFVFLVCEYVDGQTLDETTAANPQEVCNWGLQIVDALRYAHSHGIVHRDLKPANLLLNSDGSVLLTDFGIAGEVSERQQGAGTVGFAPPEQLSGEITPSCDYYALGATLYTLLASRKPFSGDFIQVVAAQQEEDYEKLSPQLPNQLTTLVNRLLKADPENRLSDLEAISQLLNESKASCSAEAEG